MIKLQVIPNYYVRPESVKRFYANSLKMLNNGYDIRNLGKRKKKKKKKAFSNSDPNSSIFLSYVMNSAFEMKNRLPL